MNTYALVLLAHSWLRWGLLALAVGLTVRTAIGWRQSRAWTALDERLHAGFAVSLDVQMTLGLLLYFVLSPISGAFLASARTAIRDPALRYFGVEHVSIVLAAIGLTHVVRRRSKRAKTAVERHRQVFLATFGTLLLLVLAMPVVRLGRALHRGGLAVALAPSGDAKQAACPEIYATRCAACHGVAGKGDGVAATVLQPPPTNFTRPGWSAGRGDQELAAIIRDGGARHGLGAGMPSNGDLSDAERAALIRCLRSFRVGE